MFFQATGHLWVRPITGDLIFGITELKDLL